MTGRSNLSTSTALTSMESSATKKRSSCKNPWDMRPKRVVLPSNGYSSHCMASNRLVGDKLGCLYLWDSAQTTTTALGSGRCEVSLQVAQASARHRTRNGRLAGSGTCRSKIAKAAHECGTLG